MMEPLAAIQRLAEARVLGIDSKSATPKASTILQSSLNFSDGLSLGQQAAEFPDENQMSQEDEEDYEDEDSMSALCPAPNNANVSEREPANAVLFNYRGERVAGFEMDAGARHMICLPQVYKLFLKHLVGGLHTVYTKLKRLHIHPIICNVEQVRALRSLGAIQPGVNRCKLIQKSDFEKLYDDCTNTKSRPGRPPKRSDGTCSLDDCWNSSGSSHNDWKREQSEGSSFGGLIASSSNNNLSSVSSSNLIGSNTPNILQLHQSRNPQQQLLENLLPLTAQQLFMQHMMAAAAAVVSQQQIQQQQDAQQQQKLRSISSSSLNNSGNNTHQGGDETCFSSNESSSAANKQHESIAQNANSKAQEWTNNNGHSVLQMDGLTTANKEVKCQRAESNRFSNQFTILNDEVEDYSTSNCPNNQSTELNNHNSGPLNLTNNSKFSTTPTAVVVQDFEDEDSSSNGQSFLVTKTSTREKERARDNNSDGGDKNNSSGNQSETDNDTFEREKSLSATLNDRGESESSNRSGSQNSPSQNSPSESDQAMQFVLTKITTMIETASNAFKGHYDKLAKLTACLQGELVSLKNSELQTRKLHKIEKQRSDLYFRKYSHLKREAHNLRKRARKTSSKIEE